MQLNQPLFANDVSNEMHVPRQLGQLELLLERAARLEQTHSSILVSLLLLLLLLLLLNYKK